MGFKLQIKFSGLCAFVPNTKEEKSMRVFLIDARAPGVASNGVRHVSHLPAIKFNLADLVSNKNQPFFFINSNSENAFPTGQWVLNGDDIEIKVDGKNLPLNNLTILKNEEKSFYLVPFTKNIYPELNGLTVKDECFVEEENLSKFAIAGRLQLTDGSVGAYSGLESEYISIDEYYFSPSTNNYKQRIASSVLYETNIDSKDISFFSKRTGQGFTFSPKNGEVLELSINNIPPDGLEAVKMDDPENTVDFELAYLIAKENPSVLRIPARSPLGPEYPRPLLCAPIIYNPDDRA